MFIKGDLVYIPQSVILYGLGQNSVYVNKKPILALFVNDVDASHAKVLVDGKQWLVKKREVYLSRGE